MKIKIAFFLITLFFLSTRLIFLPQIPASLYWDEASIGYNAYSISESLKDEWGKFLPVHFRAFGEFKLPVYIYSVAFFVKLFGLNEWSVRVPASLYAFATMMLIILICRKLFTKQGEKIGLLSSFLLSISPWFFIVSRAGFEATAGIAFFCLGFFSFLNSKNSFLVKLVTILAFIPSIYSYNSFRIITPLFLIWVFISWLKNLNRKSLVYLPLLLLLFLISFYPAFKLNVVEQTSRFKTTSILSQGDSPVNVLYNFTSNYLSDLSPDFLFTNGDKNLRSHTGFGGMLYLLDIIFISVGIFAVLKQKQKKSGVIFYILFLSLIPAAISKESPHALRAILFIPFISIITAYGIVYLKDAFKLRFFYCVVLFFYAIFFFAYFYDFIKNYNLRSSLDWQYPYKEIFKGSIDLRKYDKVFISDYLGQPYIFALYYLEFPPDKFQKTVEYNPPDKWGHSLVKSFNNFSFNLSELENEKDKKLIIFAKPGEYVGSREKTKTIKDLSGKAIFSVYE